MPSDRATRILLGLGKLEISCIKNLNLSGGELIFGIAAKEIIKIKNNIADPMLLAGMPVNIL